MGKIVKIDTTYNDVEYSVVVDIEKLPGTPIWNKDIENLIHNEAKKEYLKIQRKEKLKQLNGI